MKKIVFLCSILLLLNMTEVLHAQTLGTSQNPPGIEWKRIDTPNFSIVYPAQIEKDAQYVANYMEYVRPFVAKTVTSDKNHTTILLYTNYAVTNGFAALAPRRTVWFNTPPQESFAGTLGWYNLLGLHEYRHLLQFDSMNTGEMAGIKFLFGETLFSILPMIAVPGWYYEGDAVVTETLLSDSGRGRTPEFDAVFRSQLLSGKKYGYYQSINGSYSSYNPLQSPYLLGYFMNTKLRKDNGPYIMKSINSDTMNWFFLPYRYTWKVRSNSGSFVADKYDQMIDEISEKWRTQLDGLAITEVKPVKTSIAEEWTSYTQPQRLADGSVISFRSGTYGDTGIVKINPGGEDTMLVKTYLSDISPSAGGTRIAWTESIPDIRYEMRSFSDIYIMDTVSLKKWRLTEKSRMLSPAISPDGLTICAVEYTNENICSLVFLDANSGIITSRIKSEDGKYFTAPRFSTDGKSITWCALDKIKGKSIMQSDSKGRDIKTIVPSSHENISNPVCDGKYIYYSSPYSGIDNIYAIELSSKKKFQVTSRPFGAYSPSLSADGKTLLFSDVIADGYQAVEITIDPKKWIPLQKVDKRIVFYADPLLPQEQGGSIQKDIEEKEYPSSPYSGLSRGFDIHSWYPQYNLISKDLSFAVVSTNKLNTLNATAKYIRNFNENTNTGKGAISYAGFFPLFEISGSYGSRTGTYTENEKVKFYTWNENSISGGVSIPLNLSRRVWLRSVTFGVNSGYTRIQNMPEIVILNNNDHSNYNGTLIPLKYTFSIMNTTSNYGYINPKWGQILSANFSNTPLGGDYTNTFFSTHGMFYFPGFFNRHNLFFEGGFEKQDDKIYRFESEFLFSRGYEPVFSTKMAKGSANYTLPLLYPDLNILYLFYLKQIYLNGFYDITSTLGTGKQDYYHSTGGELMFQIGPFNLPFPLHIGVRYSHCFNAEQKKIRNVWGVVFALGTALF